MELNVSEIPSVLELEDFSGSVILSPTSSGTIVESNAMITNVSTDIVDSGVLIDFTTTPSELFITGRYEQQFSNIIKYNEPQVDKYTPANAITVNNWGDMPEPNDPAIWFIFAWIPPMVLSRLVTYTISAEWDEEDTAAPGVITAQTGTFTATQLVVYDSDANRIQFERYV
jgi:hypothetical protein